MGLFLSTHINRLDKKGRVSVPSTFRAALAQESFQGVVLFGSHNFDALEGFSYSFMEELGQRLDSFDLFSDSQDDMATTIFGDSVQLPFDGEGRIVLPQSLIAHCGLEDAVAFVGLGKKFQIWKPESFEARKAEARARVKDNKMTLPKGGAS